MENPYGLKNLDEVWKRVSALSEPQTEHVYAPVSSASEGRDSAAVWGDDKTVLGRFIEEKQKAVCVYKTLASKCGGRREKAAFRKLSQEEYAHLKKLQRFYFLLTGDSYTTTPPKQAAGSVLTLLRDRYLAETESESSYRATAAASSRKLSAVYEAIAADEARHASELERMLEKVIG